MKNQENAMPTETSPPLAGAAPSSMPSTGSNDSILHQLSHTYNELAAAFERQIGMSRARWAILSRLNREEPLTQTTLAQLVNVDAAAVTRQVKQLEAEGLVTRWTAPEDNRFTIVALTEAGRAFVAKRRAVRDGFERTVTAGLTDDDIEHMRRSLQHMRHNLKTLAASE